MPPPHPSSDPVPRMRVDAPRFSGEDRTGCLFRVQKYFDYFSTPEDERFHLVAMLIDHPTSEWFRYYQANNCDASWPAFLTVVQQRFDPDYYENYIGLLSKLQQTATVMDYQSAFETLLNKVTGVLETTLIAMYIAGLKQPVQREVKLKSPTTLQATFALARELSACHQEAHPFGSSRRVWASRPSNAASTGSPTPLPLPSRPTPQAPRSTDGHPPPPQLRIVRLTTSEKAERSKKGLCWYCDERWIQGHQCKRRFLVFMGPDEDEDHGESSEQNSGTCDEALITADISSMHFLAGSPSPRSLKLMGSVHGAPVQVLLDGGSTHNFIHPAVVERLTLVLHPVAPFRVYVGNSDSLRCSYSCPQTPLTMQGHVFDVDLFLLEIHGPDIVLGVQWLQTLGKVAHDYANLMMEFALYGREPPNLFATMSIRSRSPAVEELLRERADLLQDLKTNLTKMQHRMRAQANRHRRDVTFQPGDLVLLKLQPYRQHSVARPGSQKLSRRYYGPFQVIERIGAVAYRLRLPEGCRIHDVVHVSLLHPFIQRGSTISEPSLPADFYKSRPDVTPVSVVRRRIVLVDGHPQEQWLVQWSTGSTPDATWEPVQELRRHFPNLALEDKDVSKAGGVDTDTFVEHEEEATVVPRPRRTTRRPKRYDDYD
ncbi:unnamed protein product [Cuscuta campestris]|uniref:Uncharacterized protein n=1 Tax=Cuscuta campestris TaxID=132261 RepID=A0A484LF79_9ASTE|nr:unnamed protein product [Cuscuta campestris]